MFRTLLIANRGEIACRIARSARRMGIRTIAVYSDADRDAPHVRAADEARRIGPAAARASYLDGDAVLEAARAARADALHPGYGFLAENAGFAAACARAGIAFVGPSAEAIAAMGDKAAAKRLMQEAGVPLVPGYHGEAQDAQRLEAEARSIGYPVLIKAAAGGGGKGMRVVRAPHEFAAALESARREAASAFGDERVLVERYLERPRHIEVQVFGDARGGVVHLFERDCSVQRRHQKVLEEAPAPGVDPALRARMGEAAVAAARAIAYTGAGTVEFIAETGHGRPGALTGRFYFMEMNTRLQVEHAVTEMICGVDLVEWQLRVAAGEVLPLGQEALAIRGHALEARVYAEDPERGFLPSTGRLVHVCFPESNARLRVDAGVETGTVVTPDYDPMLAKVIAWGEDRGAALARLGEALARTEIAGPANNVEFLVRLAASPAFAAGEIDTAFIERHRTELLPARGAPGELWLAAATLAELREEERAALERARGSGDPHSPWHRVDGWRLNADSRHDFAFVEAGERYAVGVRFGAEGLGLVLGERELTLAGEALADGRMLVHLDGRTMKLRALRAGRDWHLFGDGAYRRLSLEDDIEARDVAADSGRLLAPMPGTVIALYVQPGGRVAQGDPLVTLEAMKMEHTLVAPGPASVKALRCALGERVDEGAELIVLEPLEPA